MFEKESKNYQQEVIAKKDYPHSIAIDWQRGAVFGYNKANEWHNLEENSDDLPKENMKQVIVKLSDGSYEMGYYCIHNNSWWANDCPDYDDELGYYDYNTGEKIYPIKWKEIE